MRLARLGLLAAAALALAPSAASAQGAGQIAGAVAPNGGLSANVTVGSTIITGGTTGRVLYDNAGILGEYVISGTGSVCMTTSCSMTTPILGTPTSGTLTNTTGFPLANLAGAGTGVLALLAGASSGTGGPAGTASPQFSGSVGIGVAPSFTLDVAGTIRYELGADATPFTKSHIIVYGGTGVDTNNWAYFGYGNDGFMREVFGKTGSSGRLYWGTSSAMDNTGAFTISMSLTEAGLLALPGITSDATHTDSTVCQDTTTHALYAGSGTAGICLGTSSARFKNNIIDIQDGLVQVMGLRPVNFFYNRDAGDYGAREQYGFLAEDVVSVLPKLTHLNADGEPNSVDILGMLPVLVRAIQQQQVKIEALEKRLEQPTSVVHRVLEVGHK